MRRWKGRATALVLMLGLAGCESQETLAPLPPGTLGPGGGSLSFENGAIRIDVPGGALDAPLALTAALADSSVDGLATSSYVLGPTSAAFAEAVTVRIALDAAALAGIARPEDVTGAVETDGGWQGIPDSSYDPATGAVTFRLVAFGDPATQPVTVLGDAGGSSADGARGGGTVYVSGGAFELCDEAPFYGEGGYGFGGLLPRYVDGNLGSDGNTGSLAQPWKTIRHGVEQLVPGQKLVVFGPYTYAEGEFGGGSLVLPPNVVIQGEGNPVLHLDAEPPVIPPLLLVNTTPNAARFAGFVLSTNEIVLPGLGPSRRMALHVRGGTPAFFDCESKTTGGIRIDGGTPLIRGWSLRNHAARIQIRGGSPVIRECEIRSPSFPESGPWPAVDIESATACLRRNDIRNGYPFGVRVRGDLPVTLWANEIRACSTGVALRGNGAYDVTSNTIRGNEVGVYVGQYPPDVTDPAMSQVAIRSNELVGNARYAVGIATAGEVDVAGNAFDTSYRDWYGPPPVAPGVNVAWLLDPYGRMRWWDVSGGPSRRFGAAMGFSADVDRAVLFGGRATGVNVDDTWEFDFDAMRWSGPFVPVIRPSPRLDAAMTRSEAGDAEGRVYLFGGHTSDANDVVFDDLWRYDAIQGEWAQLSPTPDPDEGLPAARYGATFSRYDGERFFLHGGIGADGLARGDSWVYLPATNTWAYMNPSIASAAPRRGFHMMVDVPDDAWPLICFGGQESNGTPLTAPRWGDTGTWPVLTIQTGSVEAPPGARTQGSLDWYADLRPLAPVAMYLLFGGSDGEDILDAPYRLIVNHDTNDAVWEPLHLPSFTASPSPRARHATTSRAWEGGRQILLFGGTTGAGGEELGDTWVLSAGGHAFRQR